MIRALAMFGIVLLAGTVRAAETSKAPRVVLAKADLGPCVVSAGSLRVSLVVHVDGSWAIALPPATEPTVLRCIEQAFSAALGNEKLKRPAADVVVSRLVTGGGVELPAREEARGGVGAVCGRGGAMNPLNALEPVTPCREGLTCCASGGAAGSPSVCMSLGPPGICPPYP